MRLRAPQRRRTLALPAAAGLTALLAGILAGAGAASARTIPLAAAATGTGGGQVVFQANTNFLYSYNPANNQHVNSHLDMLAASSPSISDGESVFVANTGILWLWHPGDNAHRDSGLRVHAGSPAIAASALEFAVVFQGSDGDLWIYYYVPGKGWAHYDTHRAMMPGSSPALTASPGGGWEVAYQGLDRRLYLYGYSAGHPGSGIATGEFMNPASSPSITVLTDGRYQVAYEYYTHRLAIYTTKSGNVVTRLDMDPGTSPSIAAGGEVAYQSSNGHLWLYHPANNTHRDTGLGMTPGTSPAITFLPGGYEIAFQADTGILWTYYTTTHAFGSGLGMWISSSPAVAS